MRSYVADQIRFEPYGGGYRAIIATRGADVAEIMLSHAIGIKAAMDFLALHENEPKAEIIPFPLAR